MIYWLFIIAVSTFEVNSLSSRADFLQAFEDRDLAVCKELISAGFSFDSMTQENADPFAFNLLNGGNRRVAQMRDFLLLGGDINVKNSNGLTILEALVNKERFSTIDVEMFRLLSERFKIENHLAHLLLVKLLSRPFDKPALLAAELLAHQFDVDKIGPTDQAALSKLFIQNLKEMKAEEYKLKKLTALRLKVSDVESIISKALSVGNMSVIHEFLNKKVINLPDILILAAKYADEFIIEHLLFHEEAVNVIETIREQLKDVLEQRHDCNVNLLFHELQLIT